MRAATRLLTIAMILAAILVPGVPANEGGDSNSPKTFEKITTTDGKIFHDCKVVRVEPDSLVLQHRTGIARISFFDLSREIQESYQFDPFAAIEHYRTENERQREIRWKRFWERQRFEAEQAEAEANQKLVRKALSEWIPVQATVLQSGKTSLVARCRRVVFEKTTRQSKLGFEVEGPPKRKLIDFAGGSPVRLQLVGQPGKKPPGKGTTWKGYVSPHPDQRSSNPELGPVYQAVTLP